MKLYILALAVSISAQAPASDLLARSNTDVNEYSALKNYVHRRGAELWLNGEPWTASGANVYWLGLDENVRPPPGEPFYAPLNASYPTFRRITEVMNTLRTMGAHLIRSQTLGVSVGNPLSIMPALGQYNDRAFATIDWSVYQARQHGLRIMAPLVDNYVGALLLATRPELSVLELLPRRKVRLPALSRDQYQQFRFVKR